MSRQGVLDQVEKLCEDGHLTASKQAGKVTKYTLTPLSKVERTEMQKRTQPVYRVDQSASQPHRLPSDCEPVYTIDRNQSIALTGVVYPIDSNHHEPSLNRQLPAADASGMLFEIQTIPATAIPPKPRTPKKPSDADPRFVPFRDAFTDAFMQAHGSKYRFRTHDGVNLSKFLRDEDELTVDRWTDAISWCRMVSRDKYAPGCVRQTGSLAAFCSSWSSIIEFHSTYKPSK